VTKVAHPVLPGQEAVTDQIYDLAKTPGVTGGHEFAELLSLVTGESNFKPHAHNSSTGAEGPFQFVKSTWLALLKTHGEALGVKPELLAEIKENGKGRPTVAHEGALKTLLALRNDIALSTRMAAKYLDDNRTVLGHLLHRAPSKAEVQLSFLLGPSGTARLVKTAEQSPAMSVADVLPHAAHANRNLFYTPEGKARTVGETLAYLAGRSHANEVKFAAYMKRQLPGVKFDVDV